MYFNSKRGERDIKKIKDDFMRNQIDHMNYNHFLSSKLGSNYYMGLNIKSLEKEIDELTSRSKDKEPTKKDIEKYELLTGNDFTKILADKH